MQRPKLSHLAGTKRILRQHLRGILDYRILFPAADEKRECKLVGYTYSRWSGDAYD